MSSSPRFDSSNWVASFRAKSHADSADMQGDKVYPVISLRKAATELERLEELIQALEKYYAQGIRATGEYAVAFRRDAVASLREQLRSLEERCTQASATKDYPAIHESWRTTLREYQEQGEAHLSRMRKDLESAAAAMKVFADGVAANGNEHETQLIQEIQRLEALARSDKIEEIRAGIRTASAALLAGYEQLQRSNQLTVAQLRDEIQVLHRAIDEERRQRHTDRTPGVWNREKLNQHMDLLLRQDRPFCVLVVGIRNWKRLLTQYSRATLQSVLASFTRELQRSLNEDAIVGLWRDDLFTAILDIDPSGVIGLSGEVKKRLPGSYNVMEKGAEVTVKVDTAAGIVDRRQGIDAQRFYVKLRQLMDALGAG
jgi:GGDEF domain-containing protein